MNTMSLSPVKPPLNTGTHTVPAAATNLTKPTPPLPSGTPNFTPIGLIPEAAATVTVPAKPIQTQPTTVAVVTNAEKSADSCSKPLPTSNGTVFCANELTIAPTVVPVANACPSGPPNGVENCDTAQNLTINNAPPLPPPSSITTTSRTVDPAPSESTDNVAKSVDATSKTAESVVKPSNDEKKEDTKVEVKKPTTPQKTESSSTPAPQPDTKPPVKIEIALKDKETVPNETAKKEEKKGGITTTSVPSATKTPSESIPNNETVVSPAKKEPTVTPPNAGKSDKEAEQTSTIAPPSIEDRKDAETKVEESVKTTPAPKTTKRKAKEASPVETASEDSADGRKSKRLRLPTQPYQSPIPELQFIAKLQTPVKTTPKNAAEKIIAFYKNEFLAVRNPEGSFYICQTFQNIYKNSTKIRIRWFTNLPQDVFTPDFYDTTEFDCILTNVTMNRLEKDRWKLSDHERTRIENILKRSLDVEQGVVEQPSVTEEHPDGLDLSLYRDEAQLAQLKKRKKKPASPKKSSPDVKKSTTKSSAAAVTAAKTDKPSAAVASGTKKSARLLQSQSRAFIKETKNVDSTSKSKKDKKEKKNKKRSKAVKKTVAASAAKQSDKSNSKTWEPSVKASNSSRVVLSLKKDDVAKPATAEISTRTATKRTSSVSLKAGSNPVQSLPPPTKRRKEEAKPATAATTTTASAVSPAAVTTPVMYQTTAAERSGKVRNAGSAVTAKINSAAMRTTKDKGSKAAAVTTTTTNQRKK